MNILWETDFWLWSLSHFPPTVTSYILNQCATYRGLDGQLAICNYLWMGNHGHVLCIWFIRVSILLSACHSWQSAILFKCAIIMISKEHKLCAFNSYFSIEQTPEKRQDAAAHTLKWHWSKPQGPAGISPVFTPLPFCNIYLPQLLLSVSASPCWPVSFARGREGLNSKHIQGTPLAPPP